MAPALSAGLLTHEESLPEAVAEAVDGEAAAPSDEDDADKAEPSWTGSLSIGATTTEGNTKVATASATADAVKEMEDERLTVGFAFAYAEDSGVRSQRKTFGNAKYDWFTGKKSYLWSNVALEGDSPSHLDLRTILGAGYGYKLRDDDKVALGGELGLAYYKEQYGEFFEDGALIEESESDYVAARVALDWTYKHSERWEFVGTSEVYPSIEDEEDVYSKLDARAKATLSENMFAQFQWVWDWDNTPAEGLDRSDQLYLIQVGWSF